MKILNSGFDTEQFFKQLKSSPSPILFLDYDGTLAPFVAKRNEAFPYEGVRHRLQQLISETRTRVVMVSGRAIDDLIPLVGIEPPPEIFGGHGWEHCLDGIIENIELPESVTKSLSLAIDSIEQAGCDDHSECKHASVTVHERSMSIDQQRSIIPQIEAYWQNLVSENPDLELHRFDGGLELRAKGRNKGHAVQDVLNQNGDGVIATYLGDDLTDEDAFEKLDEHLKVLVRSEFRETAADLWITPPNELLEFLDLWISNTLKDEKHGSK